MELKFNNLDNRLMLLLAKKWKEQGSGGPYRISMLLKGYSEMSAEHVTQELKKMSMKGLITFTSDGNRFYLADKGISQIQSLISTDRWNSVGI